WQANGSESVRARALIQQNFGGLSSSALTVVVHSPAETTSAPAFRQTLGRVERVLAKDRRVASVQPPRLAPDGHTAVVTAGAKGGTTAMVGAAERLEPLLKAAGAHSVAVSLTGSSGMWNDFNSANRKAMMKSELLSWPVTMAIIVLAFGSLVAAGLPLLLTILGLVSSAGLLALLTHGFDISIWAMNFALMFSLALGIDYALFVVHRFRGALFGSELEVRDAVAVTMDTAGKAVLFSGLTVLPAVLGKLGPRVNALQLPWMRDRGQRSPRSALWGERLWRQAHIFGPAATLLLIVLALPLFGLRTGMPSIKVVPGHDSSRVGYAQLQRSFGAGAPGTLQVLAPQSQAAVVTAAARRDTGVARVLPTQRGTGGLALVQAVPAADPSSRAAGATIDRLRAALPASTLVGGASAENHDLEHALQS